MNSAKLLKLLAIFTSAVTLSATVAAADFEKKLEYKDGTFSDIPQNAWYSGEVKSAYELGFMNGVSEGIFDPDGNVTVSAGITMASRVHAIYNGKTIETEGAQPWYKPYVDYAVSNNIIEKEQFDNYDRKITRIEMATLFADAMPDDYFKAQNSVTEIPDVAPTEEYYNDLLKLYNAGVVMGSDEYGSFYPNNSIKRSETAAIINRVAISDNRLTKTLSDYGDRTAAHFLIDDFTMIQSVKSVSNVRSGWNYDHRNAGAVNKTGVTSNILNDRGEGYAAINRYVTVTEKGTVVLESVYTLNGDGARIYFTDTDENVLAELKTSGGTYHFIGKNQTDTKIKYVTTTTVIRLTMDLDNKKAYLVINGEDAGTYELSDAKNLARMYYSTSEEGACVLTPAATHLYTAYSVHDVFRIDTNGTAPYGWNTTGNVLVEATETTNVDSNDPLSVKIDGKGVATKKFEAVSGKFVYETQLVIPEYAKADFSLKSAGKTVLTISADESGKFVSADTFVRDFHNNVWQTIRVEGDTDKREALIKINGKKCATVKLDSNSVDEVEISFNNDGKVMWFDDVLVYNVYDYVDYCPKPVPATDDDWYVAMSVCSLWHEGTHFGWNCVTPYAEIEPLMGYYDEGIPEVADWEIKFMVEHGVDFQHFCWYLSSQTMGKPIKKPRLSDALHNGYFNAKYSDMQKFCIMWENASIQEKNADYFYNELWNYWVDWYFSDDRYMTIENKAVLTIYRYGLFVDSMGGEENAKKVVEFMDSELKKLGYDGLLLFFSDTGAVASTNKKMAEVGADGLVSYTFGENSYLSTYQEQCMTNAYKAGGIDLVPSLGVGFNDIGWTGERTPNASIEEHTKVLKWARDTYLPMLASRDKENDWKGKFVFMTTWNEYGEGHYIMPAGLNGFGYLDDMRSVFSSAAGSDEYHSDVVPTENQKKRLGYLYNKKNTPMRREHLVKVEKQIGEEVLLGWNFSSKADFDKWKVMMNASEFLLDEKEQAVKFTASTSDGAVVPKTQVSLTARETQYLHLVTKTNIGSTATIYFKTTGDKDWSAKKAHSVSMVGDGEWHDYYIELSKNTLWNSQITGIRFDPNTIADTVYIRTLEFLKPVENSSYTLNVDGSEISFSSDAVMVDDGETYLAADPTNGFYSLHNTYYEFDRWNGTLFLKTPSDVEFEFVNDSDIVLVNGKEIKLAKPFEIFDGLAVIPINFFYKNGGFDAKPTENGYEVRVRDGNLVDEIKNRVPNQFEFNVDDDYEGWKIGMAEGSVYGGQMIFDATPATSSTTGFDAQITNKGVVIDSELYTAAEIRMRWKYADQEAAAKHGNTVTFYFATNLETGLSETKAFRSDISKLEKDEDGYVVVKFDLKTNDKWKGTVNTIRFDPTNNAGRYEIDYIRMIPDPAAEEKIAAAAKKAAEEKEKLMAVDKGEPFYIRNADAEQGDNSDKIFYSHNSDTTVVEDPFNKDNKVLLVTCNKDTKQWVYVYQDTRFKPGVTYKVELDYYVVGDTEGNPVKGALPQVNLQYTDIKDGVEKQRADHNYVIGNVATSDGWVHLEFEHTVNAASPSRDTDRFSVFTSPLEKDGKFQNLVYMLDNIKVSVVK